MSPDVPPIWLEISGDTFKIMNNIRWPFIPHEPIDFPEIEKIAYSFLSSSPSLKFSANTADPKGYLILKYQEETRKYFGMWIPDSFPSLKVLQQNILDVWHYETENLHDWVQQFFALRIQKERLRLFQNSQNYAVSIPPIFVLNAQQINGLLLQKLRDRCPDIEDLDIDTLYSVIEDNIPKNYLDIINEIFAENEITVVHLLRSYIHTRESISTKEFEILQNLISQISQHLSEFLLLNYLDYRLQQYKKVDDKIVNEVRERGKDAEGMLKIVILRVLTRYYKNQKNLQERERYLRLLLELAPRLSWSSKMDLINAQLGLSETASARGDYFRAMTFYSFAKQGFSSIGKSELSKEMELEYQRISILSANQLLQHALYNINHNNKSRNTLLLLIDGVQSCFAHFIKYRNSSIELETILAPLLQSAITQLQLEEQRVNDLFPEEINFEPMMKTAEYLKDVENRSTLIPALQKHIEDLSFKDQKMVERISVFYEDGRHIGDYEMRDGEFYHAKQDANQSLFSSAMSAVSMLISEATQTDSSVEEITVGNKSVIYNQGKYITFCLIANTSNSNLKQLVNNVVRTAENRYDPYLANWDGNLSIFNDLAELLAPLSFYTIDLGSNPEEIQTD